MPTIEEVITKLKETDEDSAGVVSKLLQDHDNFKTQSRRWEDQAKTNKDDAEAFRAGNKPEKIAELEQKVQSLETKVSEKDTEIETRDSKIGEFEQEKERGKLIASAAKEAGLPSHLHGYLQGSTEEELKASAEKLKQDFKFGEVDGFGNDRGQSNGGTLEAGKDLYDDYTNKK